MLSKDLGIDLGTTNILIHVKGKGIVLNEPAVVVIDKINKKLLAVGTEDYISIGGNPGDVEVIHPIKDGVIADFEVTEAMLRHYISKIGIKGFLSKPRMLISCPTNITQVEKKAIRQSAEKAGAKEVYIEEEPKVAAIGAGLNIFQPSGKMVIDIGGGTTDIAVMSMGEIVTAESIKTGGNAFNEAILQYVKKKYQLLIGAKTAEEIKMKIATVYEGSRNDELTIRGRGMVDGQPQTITLYSQEIQEALKESMALIIHATKSVLERTSPELSADIIEHGIVLTGGGALIHGLDALLTEELNVSVTVAKDPLNCVVRGTGILLARMK